MTARPFEVVCARLEIISGSPPKLRAKCPGHGSRSGSLAVDEAQDGKVLLDCKKGCAPADIVRAIGLSMRDLFPSGEAQRQRDRDMLTQRRQFAQAPEATVNAAIDREIERLRERLRGELDYDRPLRASDYNAIRKRIAKIYEIELAPLPPALWECPGMDDDPNWPTLYMTALEEAVRDRWHAAHRHADAWESDPSGPTFEDRLHAEQVARAWLRGMA
jgi:hypothetical protein